jgi:hypothetical protein
MNLDQIESLIGLLKNLEGNEKPKKSKEENLGKHICILQRGWVFVGDFSKIGNDCFLDNASVIRSWGTTKGLGEIAENGPIKDKTILDSCPQVRFHYGTLVASIKCNDKKW